jgi:hypothetical protein
MQPPIQTVIRALAEDGRTGALGLAEYAVDSFAAACPTAGDRALALDILLRDLASLRGVAPHLSAFVNRIESYVTRLRQTPLPQAA